MAQLPTGTVTFLFTDIEGSTKLLQRLGPDYALALTQHQVLLRDAFAAHGGVEVDTQGDAFFVAFPTAPEAVAAAAEATSALAHHAWPEDSTLRVRIGLHTGTPQLVGDHYVGLDVHRAARIAAAGHGGQVLLSQATRELVAHALPPGVALRDLGPHRLKDLQESEPLYQLVFPDPNLPAEFPPLKTLDTYQHNLPLQPTPMLGREEQMAALCALLRRADVRLVTLTGTGGIGKTRLSLQVAAELLEDFADGVWFVRLSRLVDPALVVPTIAQTLGLQEQRSQPIAETLRAHLANKRLLLVLDNFEQVIGAASEVAGLLTTSPGLKTLVTSRTPLHLRGERVTAVPPLPMAMPDHLPPLEQLTQYAAIALFVERAQAAQDAFTVTSATAPAIAEICVRLDGLPLAIELAAARVRVLPPEALLKRLEPALPVLTGGPRDLEERQQTMRATLTWSYELLAIEEQRLFRRLAVFVGGWTLEAAEAVCAASESAEPLGIDVLEGLGRLVDHCLAQQREDEGEPRFSMLYVIREFALEKLEASAEATALHRAHAAYVLTLTASSPGGLSAMSDTRWLAQVEREHDNVRAALDWALVQGEVQLALRLGVGFEPFWYVGGYQNEGRQRLATILAPEVPSEAPQAEGAASSLIGASALHPTPAVLRAWALIWLSRIALNHDDWETSWHVVHQGVEVARTSGDMGVTAVALSTAFAIDAVAATAASIVVDVSGVSATSRTASAPPLSTPGSPSTSEPQVDAPLDASLTSSGLGEALLTEALTLARRSNDPEALIFVLGDAAYGLLTTPQEFERGRAFAEEVLQLSRRVGNRSMEAWTDALLAEYARRRGDVALTTFHARRALDLMREHGFMSWTLNCLEPLVWVAEQVGDRERAARLLGACAAEAKRTGDVGYVYAHEYGRESEAFQARIRAALGEERWQAAYASGQALSREQAITEALDASG